MSENEHIIQGGPFKGKRIELASTAGIKVFEDIAEDFMLRVFDLEPGEYLITDESSLPDFTGVDDLELADIHRKIHSAFGLDVSDLRSGNLLEIFIRIYQRLSGTV